MIKIKVKIVNRIYDDNMNPITEEEKSLDYFFREKENLLEFVNSFQIESQSYLYVNNELVYGNFSFCYIDNKINWSVPLEKVTAKDLIDTFGSDVELRVVFDDGGGLGFVSPELWQILSYVLTGLQVYDGIKIFIGIPKDIKSMLDYLKFRKEKHPISEEKEKIENGVVDIFLANEGISNTNSFIEAIENRKIWGLDELADYLNCSSELAGTLLKLVGYRYNEIIMKYQINEELNKKYHDYVDDIDTQIEERYKINRN